MSGRPVDSGDGTKMRVHSRLGRLVVVGHDGQDRVGAGRFGILAQFDRLAGRIGAGAGDDRYPAARGVDRNADDGVVLGPIQVGRFTGRAAHDQRSGAFLDLTIAKALERGGVDLVGLVERRRQGRRVARQSQKRSVVRWRS